MKKAATKNALTAAIVSATIIPKGSGSTTTLANSTVKIVRKVSAIPIAQSCLGVEI